MSGDIKKVHSLDVDKEAFLFGVRQGSFLGIVIKKGGTSTSASYYRFRVGNVILEGNLNRVTFAGVPFVNIFVTDGVLHRMEVQNLSAMKISIGSVRGELIEALSMILSVHDPRIAVDLVGDTALPRYSWRVALSSGPSRSMSVRERGDLLTASSSAGTESFLEFPANTDGAKLLFVKRAAAADEDEEMLARDSASLMARYARREARVAILHWVDVSSASTRRLMYFVTDVGVKEGCSPPVGECVRVNVRIIQQEKRWTPGANLLAVVDQSSIRLEVVPSALTGEEQALVVRFTKDLINVLSLGRYKVTTLGLEACKPFSFLQCWDAKSFAVDSQPPFPDGFDVRPTSSRVIRLNFPTLLWQRRTAAVSTPSITQQRATTVARRRRPPPDAAAAADTSIQKLMDTIELEAPPGERAYLDQITRLLKTRGIEVQPLANVYWFVQRVIVALGEDTSPFSDLDVGSLRTRLRDDFGLEVDKPRTQLAIFMVTNEVNLALRTQYQNGQVAVEVPLLNRLLFFVSRLDNKVDNNRFMAEDHWAVTVWLCTKVYLAMNSMRVAPLAVERARSDLARIGAFFLTRRPRLGASSSAGPVRGSLWKSMLSGAFDLVKPYLLVVTDDDDSRRQEDTLRGSKEEVRGELFISYLTQTLYDQSPTLRQTQEQHENMQLLTLAAQHRRITPTTTPPA